MLRCIEWLILYFITTRLRRRARAFPPSHVWAIALDPQDSSERHPPASRHHPGVHRRWWRIPVPDQLLCGGIVGVLLLNSKALVHFLVIRVLTTGQVLGLVILRVKEPMLERWVIYMCGGSWGICLTDV